MAYALRPIGSYLNIGPLTASSPAPLEPTRPAAAVGGSAPKTPTAAQFVANAKKFLGQPYAWGGGHGKPMTTPGPVDASGLVQQAARLTGINLDGNAATQQTKGRPVSLKSLQPGDLLFHGTPATHVGIYVGNGQAIVSSKPGTNVRLTTIGYFDNARRVFEPVAGAPAPTPAPAPAPTPAPAPAPAPKGAYTVKVGDSLWRIAKDQLGDGSRWQELYAMNPFTVANPNKLIPGTILKLPTGEPTGGSAAPANPYFNDYDF